MKGKFYFVSIVIIAIFFNNGLYPALSITNDTGLGFEKKSEIVVAFDFSHEPASINYQGLQYHLEYEGFNVQIIENRSELTTEELAVIDVLLIIAPTQNYNETELNTINEYVDKGGAIWLISDYTDTEGSVVNEIAKELFLIQ